MEWCSKIKLQNFVGSNPTLPTFKTHGEIAKLDKATELKSVYLITLYLTNPPTFYNHLHQDVNLYLVVIVCNSKEVDMEIFLLKENCWMTTRSTYDPIGIGVTSEDEAKKFVEESPEGIDRDYVKIRIFEKYRDSLK